MKREENNTVVRWGWIGKIVAGVVITGLPAMIVSEIVRANRENARLTLLEEQARHQVRTLVRIEQWIAHHDEYVIAKTSEINSRLGRVEARTDVLDERTGADIPAQIRRWPARP